MVRKYGIPLIGILIEAKEKNQVRLELDTYFDHLMPMATNIYLQVSANNMKMYIFGLALLRTELHMLQDELDRGSKSVYPEEMEERVCFHEEIIKKYVDTIVHYQA